MHQLLIIAGAAVLAAVVIGTGKRLLFLLWLYLLDKEQQRNLPSGIVADDLNGHAPKSD